jgi:protein TonB
LRRRQQGAVLLSVKVSAQGRALRVQVKESSGFPLLDRAAVHAVQNWEFEPARLGRVAVDSETEVPVRFQLAK